MKIEELVAMPKIDAHAHLIGKGPGGVDALAVMLERHSMRWLDICWYHSDGSLQEQIELARHSRSRHAGRFSWVTTFSLAGFNEAGWLDRAIAAVDAGRAEGAVGVKVWKNIGMELKDNEGRFVMIDDPRFDPLLETVRARDMTLAAHIGEPRNCWLPVDRMTVEGDRSYFSAHPEYHGLLHPEIPGYWEQVLSRDRMLERHPGLRVVGCHLGSTEFDIGEMASRLDRYPHLALDMSARICHLQIQRTETVREFLIKYRDRLLYGSDAGWEVDVDDLGAHLEAMERTYLADYCYFATDGVVDAPTVKPGYQCQGLALPREVLEKLFYRNACDWYPGIEKR